jgi:ABC-type dipeptide/oligopeptide/nickel transport system permease subunit
MKFSTILRKMRKSLLFIVGFSILVIIVLTCATSSGWTQWDPEVSNLRERLIGPDWFTNGGLSGHPLGTDPLGRDILTRLLQGGWTSLKIAFIVTLISMSIGTIVGLITGYFGGVVDMVVMRICDVLMSIPNIMLAIVIVAILGSSMINLIFTLFAIGWVRTSRMVRSVVLNNKHQEYISASKVLGAGTVRILWKELFPNTITQLMIAASSYFGGTILVETRLSYLGMGIPVPQPSWGNIISDGRQYLAAAPWVVIFPGVALMLTVLGFNFLGDGIRDVFDPKNTD